MENESSDDPQFEYFKNLILEHLGKSEPYNKGRFTDYETWDDDLFYKAEQFKKKKGVFPNIMLAQKSTYDKIDEACKKNPAGLHCIDGDEGAEEFDGGLSSFVTKNFEITFCLDVENKLKDNEFKLIFDEKPTFDGEEIEEDYSGEIYYPSRSGTRALTGPCRLRSGSWRSTSSPSFSTGGFRSDRFAIYTLFVTGSIRLL